MSLTAFLLFVMAIGGGVFLHGHLPKGAIANFLDDLIDVDRNARRGRHQRNKGKKKLTKAQRQRAEVRMRKKLAEQNQYRSISIKCGKNPCSAAKRLEGKRALVAQFPRVPLSNCDAEVCECTYEHHADRRGGPDRRDIVASLSNDKNARFNSFKSRSGRDRRRNSKLDEELKALDISFD